MGHMRDMAAPNPAGSAPSRDHALAIEPWTRMRQRKYIGRRDVTLRGRRLRRLAAWPHEVERRSVQERATRHPPRSTAVAPQGLVRPPSKLSGGLPWGCRGEGLRQRGLATIWLRSADEVHTTSERPRVATMPTRRPPLSSPPSSLGRPSMNHAPLAAPRRPRGRQRS